MGLPASAIGGQHMTFRKKYSLFCWAAGTNLTRSDFELPPLPTGEIPAPWVFLGDHYRPGEGPLLLASGVSQE